MPVTVRPVRLDDAAAVVELTGVIDTTSFATAESFRALLEGGAPEGTERLVAEVDGDVVAWAPSGVHVDGSGWLWIGVAAGHRGRGIGRTLYDRIEAGSPPSANRKLGFEPSVLIESYEKGNGL